MYETFNGSRYIKDIGWTVIPLENKLSEKRFREAFKDPKNTLMANGGFACSVNDKITLLEHAKKFYTIVYWVWMGVHESHMLVTSDGNTMDDLIAILTGDESRFERLNKIAELELRLKELQLEINKLKSCND